MRSRIAVLAVVAAGVFLGACSGSPIVAEVNGDAITADQVESLTTDPPDGPAIEGEPFRVLLGQLIVNAALRTAAEDQFGATGIDDPDALAARIEDPPTEREATFFASVAADPGITEAWARGAAETFIIRDVVVAELATGDEADDQERDQLFFAWSAEAVAAADVSVRSQVGEWDSESASVLPPP